MKLKCPSCQLEIPADQINISADVAVCENCNETFTVSDSVHAGGGTGDFDIHQAPQVHGIMRQVQVGKSVHQHALQ